MGGVGFHDLKTFNMALLAKQCWRLLHNTETLFYQVYKAKYFPTREFLDAFLGGNPSYTWRSSWGAKSLLKEGLCWLISDGATVKVWEDTWVPFDGVLAHPSTGVEFNPNLKVRDLILDPPMEWNIRLIQSLFSEAAATLILSMPLSYASMEDSRMWWPTRDDIFSVKSAYWLGKLGMIDAR